MKQKLTALGLALTVLVAVPMAFVASYPTAVVTFTTKTTGDVIQASHLNAIQDEIVAIETDLLTAFPGGGADGGQMKFPATANPSADANTLDDYEEGEFTATLTGVSGSVTGTVKYIKIGNQVTINVPGFTGTSTTTAKTITGMPVELRPASSKNTAVIASNNGGAFVIAPASLASTGVITLYASANFGAWTASGAMEVSAFQMTYSLA